MPPFWRTSLPLPTNLPPSQAFLLSASLLPTISILRTEGSLLISPPPSPRLGFWGDRRVPERWARHIRTFSLVENPILVAEQERFRICCSALPCLLPRTSVTVGEGGTEKALPSTRRICRRFVLLLYKILGVDLQIFSTDVASTKVERVWKKSPGPNIYQGKRGGGKEHVQIY